MKRLLYRSSCVNTPPRDVSALHEMVHGARAISRRAFLRHVDPAELADIETQLGYADHPRRGLTMAGDFHVSYSSSKWKGRRCYFFTWSAIEYYFVD